MRMKTMRRVKSGLMAMVLGVSMMTAAPVDVKAETPPHALVTPCDCGATFTYQGDINTGWVSQGEETHEYVVYHCYHCRYGHTKTIKEVTMVERHTWNTAIWEDLGHNDIGGNSWHIYRISCTKCRGTKAVSTYCNYENKGYHETPF